MDIEKRIQELSAEIRAYPTPIAACDEQLSALIEERARLMEQLREPMASAPSKSAKTGVADPSPGAMSKLLFSLEKPGEKRLSPPFFPSGPLQSAPWALDSCLFSRAVFHGQEMALHASP